MLKTNHLRLVTDEERQSFIEASHAELRPLARRIIAEETSITSAVVRALKAKLRRWMGPQPDHLPW